MSCRVGCFIQFAAGATPRGLPTGLTSGGWTFINGTLRDQINSVKPDEIIFWLPFGHDDGDVPFDLASFTVCQETAGFELVADQAAFVAQMVILFQTTGVDRIRFYFGFLGAIASRWSGLTTVEKQALVAANFAPIIALRDALVALGYSDPVAVDIDTQNAPTDEMEDADFDGPNWTIVIPFLDDNNLHPGAEPWMAKLNPRSNDPLWRTVVDERGIKFFDPELNPGATWALKQSEIAGPICPYIIGVEDEPALVRALKAITRFHQVDVEPHSEIDGDVLRAVCAGEASGEVYEVMRRPSRYSVPAKVAFPVVRRENRMVVPL